MPREARRSRLRVLRRALLALTMLASMVFVAPTHVSAQADDDISELMALLPDDAAERFAELHETLGIDTSWQELVANAIDPDDYECEQSTLSIWANGLFGSLDPALLNFLFMAGAPFWPGDYTVLFDNDPSDTYIGTNGEETREQFRRHRDNNLFWDVPTDDIQLHGMHGADIADDAKMVPLVYFVLGSPGFSIDDAQALVDAVQAVIEAHPTLDFDSPIFTLHAFALPGFAIPGFGVIPDKLVMGDGVIDAVNALGLGDNGPDLIHAHEFAHHVQFELNQAPPYGDPETDRRTELMADALGAYYAAHARGASFQTHRVVD